MAIAVASELVNEDFTNASGTTFTITKTVAAGSVLVLFATLDYSNGVTGATVSDNLNGAWPAQLSPSSPEDDTVDTQRLAAFVFRNTAAGSLTATITYVGATGAFRGLWLMEVTGANVSAAVDGNAGQSQITVGTGTDAVTSGNFTTTGTPVLIIGIQGNFSAVPGLANAGTGFTSTTTGFGGNARTEWKRDAGAAGTKAATFTNTVANGTRITIGLAIDEATTPTVVPLSWAPRLSMPAAVVAAAAVSAVFAPVLVSAAPTVVPMSWAPKLSALASTVPAPLTSRSFAPVAPLSPPLLSWAPPQSLFCDPLPPLPALLPSGAFGPVAPLAPPLLSWSPTRAIQTDAAPVPLTSRGFAPITTPAAAAVPALSWLPHLTPPTDSAAPAVVSRGFAPVTTPAAATVTPLSWAPTLARPTLPAPVAPPSASYRPLVQFTSYALAASGNGRYLTRDGVPFFIKGDSAFGLNNQLTLTDVDTYLAARKAQGFNTVFMSFVCHETNTSNSPTDALGNLPFTTKDGGGSYTGTSGTADFSTPNDAYFAYLESVIDRCELRGFAVLAYILPWGIAGSGNAGWWPDLVNGSNTQAVCSAFGVYLANGHGTFGGFKSKRNLLLMNGSDYGQNRVADPPTTEGETRALKISRAMVANGAKQLQSGDWQAPSMSTDEPIFEPWMQLNGCYTYDSQFPDSTSPSTTLKTYLQATAGFSYVPAFGGQSQSGAVPPAEPVYLKETAFQFSPFAGNPPPPTLAEVRKAQNWAWLAGCTTGLIYGDEHVWTFPTNGSWVAALTDGSALDMARFNSFVDTVPWWDLVPSELAGMRKLIGGARGSQSGEPDDYIAAACGAAGTCLVTYVPPNGSGSQTFAVDLRSMAGNSRARWWDPTNGTYNTTSGGATSGQHSLANTASAQSFTTPGNNSAGDNDWFLVLDTLDPLTWQPVLNKTIVDPAQPVRSTMFEPVQTPAAPAVVPLSWAPKLAPVPVAVALANVSRVFAPVAPLVAPALSWRPTLAPLAPPAPPPVASSSSAPVAPLAVPPLAWAPELAPPPLPAALPVSSQLAAPVQVPAPAVPSLSWAPQLSPLVVPLAPPVSSTEVGPISPLTVAPLSWRGFTEPPPVPPPPAIPSSVVAPLTPALPVPALSWLPHVTAPYFAPPAAAGQVMVQPLVPIASSVVTPLSWAPSTSAPPLPPIGGPLSLRFGPVAPLAVPPLSWAPELAQPLAPTSPQAASSETGPVLPPAPAVTPLAWGPAQGQAAAAPAPTAPARAAAPPLPPATPTGWMLGSEVATVWPVAALADLARVFEPVVTPSVPPGAWSGAGTAPGIAGSSTISLEVGPLTVPAPQVPPPLTLQPVGVQVPEAGVATPPQSTVSIEQPKGATPVAGIGGGPSRARIRKVQ